MHLSNLDRLKKIRLNLKPALTATVLSSLLIACSGSPTRPGDATTDPESIQLDEERLKLSARQSSPKQRIKLAKQLMEREAWDSAAIVLEELYVEDIEQKRQLEFLILKAEIAIKQNNGNEALYWLNYPLEPAPIPSKRQDFKLADLRATALVLDGQYLAAARARIFQSSELSGDAYKRNHLYIWQSLLEAPQEELEQIARSGAPTALTGWAKLALATKNNQHSIDTQIAQLRRWQKQFPNHPAALDLPRELALLKEFSEKRPKKIALILPVSGRLGATGRAVRDGFLAAHYRAMKAGGQIPEITVYDSNQENFSALYERIAYSDVDQIIGPMTKDQVSSLTKFSSLPVPTLALNYGAEQENLPPELFQYGLAAEDEARQVAKKARQDGLKKIAVLLPDGPWGDRVLTAFSEEFIALGGSISETQIFTGKNDYSERVKALFNIDESNKRAQQLRNTLGVQLEFNPRRRADVDGIFLAALPKQARQIKPTLDFHFAGDLPVYATSSIYTGNTSPRKDRDLNGIMFCDIPWLLDTPSSLKQTINKNWKNAKSGYSRLYAMGVDAYQLSPRLQQLAAIPNSRVYGVTGALELDQDRRIRRHVMWAKMEKGRAKPLKLAQSQ